MHFPSNHYFRDFRDFFLQKKPVKQRRSIFAIFAMSAKEKVRDSVAIFYKLNHNKGKSYTYKHFKHSGLSRAVIYKILSRFDENGNVDRKSGSGRPKILSKENQKKLLKDVNHKSGVSQRKLASKYGVSHVTIGKTIKAGGIKYRKKIRVLSR